MRRKPDSVGGTAKRPPDLFRAVFRRAARPAPLPKTKQGQKAGQRRRAFCPVSERNNNRRWDGDGASYRARAITP